LKAGGRERGAGGGKVILVAEIWIIFFVELSKRYSVGTYI
jgi:hypothetical protein